MAEKIDALGFYCSRWSEMSPKSLWNNKFDQIFADFTRKSIAGIFLGEKLQQANAHAHNSILSMTWFSENGLQILENWPPNSPDIKIIKNVWSLLKKRVFQRHPKNIEELWAFCQEEFERIPLEYIQNLYSSIPDRLNKIVQCNGKNIKF